MAGIYIHIPFCRKACIYCDFHFSTQLNAKEEMVNAICRELELRKNYLNGQIIQSVYFGGGTPSVLSKQELDQILSTIRKLYTVTETAEITLEANPDDLTVGKLSELKTCGINRLSIGIQSFIAEELIWMNRSHTVEQSLDSIRDAQNAGFDNITIDLIYGSKFQNTDSWMKNLEMAFSLNVPHISAYNLTIEDRTVLGNHFNKGREPAINDVFSMNCMDVLMEESSKQGFLHYEISNFARPGFIAVHNSNYWKGVHYLGVGPSAHSFNGVSRQWNVAANPAYIKSINQDQIPSETEILSEANKYNEYILTGLRTMWGVNSNYIRDNFSERYYNNFMQNAQQLITAGDMIIEGETFILSSAGKKMADKISAGFFEE